MQLKTHLRAVNLTENYAKHTFQAPCCCYASGLTTDLLLVKAINMSIDLVVIKYLIFFGRKIFNERQHNVLFTLFLFIIVSRANELLCL